MSENSDNSLVSNANQPNNTATNSPPQRWKNIELLIKAAVAITGLGGLFVATNHFTDKLAAATLLNQREQAETSLRATMFNNLMDRIVNKEMPDDPKKLLLLAQLLAFNFHEHFEFKPLLIDLYEKPRLSEKKKILESLARRITDQQIDTLRATAITQGDVYKIPGGAERHDIFTSDIFFKESKESKESTGPKAFTIPYECNYIDTDSFSYLSKPALDTLDEQQKQLDKKKDKDKDKDKQLDKKKDKDKYMDEMSALQKKINDERASINAELEKIENSQRNPALFINGGPSQCITVVPPGEGYQLNVAISSTDFNKKTVALSVNVLGQNLRSVNLVYEFEVTMFDFPLTDNTAIDSNHRFAIVQKSIDKEDGRIWLRLIWFPKGYITEQERPTNYAEIQNMLDIRKEKKWYNPKTWWSNSTTPSQ